MAQFGVEKEAQFNIDWHLVALPVIQQRLSGDPLGTFKEAVARILILSPVPGLIMGDSNDETLLPERTLSNFSAWFSGVLAYAPAAYATIDNYLKPLMPDFKDIRNQVIAKKSRRLFIQFSNETALLPLPFEYLSDGEKCFHDQRRCFGNERGLRSCLLFLG